MAGARLALAGLTLVAACVDLPASPTYAADVRPILRASCIRCHGGFAAAACPATDRDGYRLDHWLDVGEVRGVAAMTERIAVRAVDRGDMPPGDGLGAREREILARWQRAGSPRGEPTTIAPPTLTLGSPVPADEPADQRLTLAYDVRAPDDDAMSWTVGWRRDGVDGALTGPLAPGAGEIAIDLGVLATGRYQLVARLRGELDDAPTEVALGAPIALPARDAAPTVALRFPRGGERLGRAAMIDVRWQTDDVDSAGPLTARLRLRAADGAVVDIAADLDARAGHAAWSPAATPPGAYDLELTVDDGAAARTARTACPVTLLP